MKHSQNSYNKLSDAEKTSLLKKLYITEKLSFAEIADQHDTYANKIRRDAKKFNIPIRDKSEAQKNALKTGKHSHPTKGKKRPEEIKKKIGSSVLKSWEALSDAELDKRKNTARTNWEKMSEDTRINMQESAIKAVRETSKTGSKLEKYIHKKLLEYGYRVDFHKEQSLVNTKLQIDLFIPTINTAIEIDGPSHFEPVWGQDSLERNMKYDKKKEGLITGKGWHLIRIKQFNDFSPARAEIVFAKLEKILQECSNTKNVQKFVIKDE